MVLIAICAREEDRYKREVEVIHGDIPVCVRVVRVCYEFDRQRGSENREKNPGVTVS